MADEPSNPSPLGEIAHGPSKFEAFLDKNQKKLIVAILAVIVALSAYIVITGLKETEDNSAGEALSAAADETGDTYDKAALRDVMDSFTDSPASGSAALLLAQEQWDDQLKEESIATLREFISDKPNHPGKPSALLALANHLLDTEKKDEATTTFQELINHPNGRFLAPFALLTLGDLAKIDGDDEKARTLYEQARDNYPNNSISIGQFANKRLALLGVQAPALIDPPAVPPPVVSPPVPIPGFPGISNPNNPFPELFPKPTTPEPTTPEPAPEEGEATPPAGDDAPPTEGDAPEEPANDGPQ